MPRGLGDKTTTAATVLEGGHPHRDVLRDLYARYRDELIAFVRGKVGGGPPEPEDVAQQAFANYAALEKPESIENPRAFLYRTAANIVTNHHRRAIIGDKHLTEERYFKEIFRDGDVLSPEIVLLDKERFAHVVKAIRKMPSRRRRFLLLHRLEGLSYAEIGRRCGVSEIAVRRQVMRAVRDCGLAIAAVDKNGHTDV